jgi:hypothetical protein
VKFALREKLNEICATKVSNRLPSCDFSLSPHIVSRFLSKQITGIFLSFLFAERLNKAPFGKGADLLTSFHEVFFLFLGLIM